MIVHTRRQRDSFLQRLFSFFRGKAAPELPDVLQNEQFRHLLEKERFRADRRKIEFCLVELLIEPAQQERLQTLCAAFRSRLRISDEIGWLDERLCVLMADTPGDAGCKVANELIELAASINISLRAKVFVYPDKQYNWEDFMRSPKSAAIESTRDDKHDDQHDDNQHDDDRCDGQPSLEPAFENAQLSEYVVGEAQPLRFCEPVSIVKRTFDFVASTGALLVFSPLFLGTALAIKCTSKGPVLFRQKREGKDGRTFTIYKFRTMIDGAEEIQKKYVHLNEQSGPAFKIKDDPRLTRLGKILRKTCIDELPQLINVLRGEMSLVGPRPLPVHESKACLPWQRRRLEVLPGMTCIWQLRGGREVDFDEWMRMDLEYIRKRGLWYDLCLLWSTASVAIFARGSV
ncbi:MAG TPA: sugar transferase [Pirellulaceae bacterium]|nr:sugar transferase [Pirellulaceae bacterium]HMO91128.1 sugar transferase [Pirellulaceae bacterium]HMP71068.1 sugar transferase [Pirellulaceae bacterium]